MSIITNTDNISFLNRKLLVSCPNPNGGLFLVDLNTNIIQKLFDGDCRGISKLNDRFILATNSHGIVELDKDYNIVNQYSFPALDVHGLKVKDNNLIFIVETAHNTVGIYQYHSFKKVDEIKVSNFNDDMNHINDLWIQDESLYLSMFSLQGGWRSKTDLDGSIVEYDICSKSVKQVHYNDLQLPHSLLILDDKIFYCESLNLNLKQNDELLAQFLGFTRGLAFDGRYFFIGQSEMRHLDQVLTKHKNVSIDCGIYIFDSSRRINKFIHIPAKQVYEIVIIEDDESTIAYPSSLDLCNPNSSKWLLSQEDWHESEPGQRWMANTQSSVLLTKKENMNSLIIEAINSFPGAYHSNVYLNDTLIGVIKFDIPGYSKFVFSTENIRSGPTKVLFSCNKTWTPFEELGTDDYRTLGLGIKTIKFGL